MTPVTPHFLSISHLHDHEQYWFESHFGNKNIIDQFCNAHGLNRDVCNLYGKDFSAQNWVRDQTRNTLVVVGLHVVVRH